MPCEANVGLSSTRVGLLEPAVLSHDVDLRDDEGDGLLGGFPELGRRLAGPGHIFPYALELNYLLELC